MRIAWFSPLPPYRSGIGDYSAELLPLLARRAEVRVFCPPPPRQVGRRVAAPPGIPVLPPEAYDPEAHGLPLYHLGNNPDHGFVFDAARRHPGVAVFHDVVQHHLLGDDLGKPWKRARYRELVEAEYGERGRELLELAWRGLNTEFEKFLFPLNTTVARASRAVVVHSHDSADRIRERAPEVPVRVIPHHGGVPPRELAGVGRAEARARLRLPPDAFLVGQFGFITRPKQPAALFGAFARLARRVPGALLLLVGMNQAGPGLVRLVDRHGLAGRVRLCGYVDRVRLYLHLRAVDAVVNLRYPTAGETSGTVARALAEGRACAVSNVGAFAELPPTVALKVEVDGDQVEELAAHLLRLALEPELRRALEQEAARYAREVLDPERCADRYLEVAREFAPERATVSPSAA
ncbi:MAG TPA: glycosyltransferase family 4 protein [Actinomycetota bacterium]|nr:glycosyltransferase family 4 protein [Actinomycetota bacterium]